MKTASPRSTVPPIFRRRALPLLRRPWTESVSDPGRQVTSCSDRETYDERLTTSCVPSQHTLTLFAPIPNAVIVGQLRAIEASWAVTCACSSRRACRCLTTRSALA